MNILFLSHNRINYFDRVRALTIIKCLSKNHNVYIATHQPNKIISYINCGFNIFSNTPFRVSYCKSSKFQKKINNILNQKKIDLIYVKRMRMAQFALNIKNIPRILDLTDAVSLQYERIIKNNFSLSKFFYKEEWKRLRGYEPYIVKNFNAAIVCSKLDMDYLKKVNKDISNMFIVPNVVDTDFFTSQYDAERKNIILFSGLMDRIANIDGIIFFINDIFPKIIKSIPNVKLYIVGPNPAYSVRRLGGHKNVIVTGKVHDIRRYIAMASVVISPIRVASGTRNKILQSMAMGKAVVSTKTGAEGLEVVNRKHIIISDNPEQFAYNVIELLNSGKTRIVLGREARKLVATKYSLNIMEIKLNEILKQIS